MEYMLSFVKNRKFAPVMFVITLLGALFGVLACAYNYMTTYEAFKLQVPALAALILMGLVQSYQFVRPILFVYKIDQRLGFSEELSKFWTGVWLGVLVIDFGTAYAFFAGPTSNLLVTITVALTFVLAELITVMSGVAALVSLSVWQTGHMPPWILQDDAQRPRHGVTEEPVSPHTVRIQPVGNNLPPIRRPTSQTHRTK